MVRTLSGCFTLISVSYILSLIPITKTLIGIFDFGNVRIMDLGEMVNDRTPANAAADIVHIRR